MSVVARGRNVVYSGQVLTSFMWDMFPRQTPLRWCSSRDSYKESCFPGSGLKQTFNGIVQFTNYNYSSFYFYLQHSMGFEATWRDSVRPLGCGM